MKSKVKLLGIIGFQRINGNSYQLARKVLDSVDADYEIVQLAEKRIRRRYGSQTGYVSWFVFLEGRK